MNCNLAVSISNRPFAHCVKFSESEISPFAFLYFQKKQVENFSNFFTASLL